MKYLARVKQVLRPDIHKIGAIEDDAVKVVADMPLPDRVEIVMDGSDDDSCVMYRYTDDDEFCGDTWHETLQHAFEQAAFEYGLRAEEFKMIEDA